MVEKTRTRRLESFRIPGVWKDQMWIDNPQYGIPGLVEYNDLFSGHQKTVSEGHPFSRLGKTDEDIGGDFHTEKVTLRTRPFRFKAAWGGQSYDGPLFAGNEYRSVATGQTFDWDGRSPAVDPNFLDQRGATAISRTAPTNPVSSAATFIGELRERLPSVPGRALQRDGLNPKNLGGEYLNVEFGIKPMLSDLRKFQEAYQKSEKILAQLERDSGRIVRRGYTFPSEVEHHEYVHPNTTYPTFYGSHLTVNHLGGGTLRIHTETRRKVWFRGAFTYHLPPQGTWRRVESEMSKLYGVRITPDTIYQLTPWSWAIDWFSNTGDVVKNLSLFANDGLVLRFGYVMCHTTQVITEEWNGSANFSGTWKPLRLVDTHVVESKQRKVATPFGFGMNMADFTDRQLAIIAALGLSRSR